MLFNSSHLFVGHIGGVESGIWSVILLGWLPIYIGIAFVFSCKWVNDKNVNFLLYIALGMMIFLFTSTCSAIVEGRKTLSPGVSFSAFTLAFFVGTTALLFYNRLKQEAFKGPMGARMPGEFPQKVFLLDYAPKGERATYNIYSLSYAIAIGIGLHGLGEGLLIAHLSEQKGAASGWAQLWAIFFHKIVEGLGIAAPVSKTPFHLGRFLFLGAIAGLPLLAGYWTGTGNESALLAFIMLSLSAGIIFYGLMMLAELVYMAYRPDINPVLVFISIIGVFSLFFGLYLVKE